MKDFISIISNISLMFSLSIIVLASLNIGIFDLMFYPLNRIKKNKWLMLLWFIISALVTAIVPDTLTAVVLIPMAVEYSNKRDMNVFEILLAVAFGSVVGNDLTPYGGGNTLLGLTLLEKHYHTFVNIFVWSKMFFIPTLIEVILCGTYLWIFYFKDKDLLNYNLKKLDVTVPFIFKSIFIIVGIFIILITNNTVYAVAIAILCIFIGNFNKDDFTKLPYKAIYVWTGAYLLGNVINMYVKHYYHFILPANIYTLGGIFIILIIVGTMTQFITNTGLAAFMLPIIMGMNFHDNIWLFTIVMKAIGLSFCTIFANGCLTVSSSYGLKQRDMLKAGIPIVILEIVAFTIYFYLMRGRIFLS